MEVRPIDGNELFGIVKLIDTDIIRGSKTASWQKGSKQLWSRWE